MGRWAAAVAAGTVLALVASSLWVPWVPPSVDLPYWSPQHMRAGLPPEPEPWTFLLAQEARAAESRWAWDRLNRAGPVIRRTGPDRLAWRVLAVEHAAILLVGGGLLALAVRRDRRRRAEALA